MSRALQRNRLDHIFSLAQWTLVYVFMYLSNVTAIWGAIRAGRTYWRAAHRPGHQRVQVLQVWLAKVLPLRRRSTKFNNSYKSSSFCLANKSADQWAGAGGRRGRGGVAAGGRQAASDKRAGRQAAHSLYAPGRPGGGARAKPNTRAGLNLASDKCARPAAKLG